MFDTFISVTVLLMGFNVWAVLGKITLHTHTHTRTHIHTHEHTHTHTHAHTHTHTHTHTNDVIFKYIVFSQVALITTHSSIRN